MLEHCPADLTTPWATGYAEGYNEGYGQGFIDGLEEVLADFNITDTTQAMLDIIWEYRARCTLGTVRRLLSTGCITRAEAIQEIGMLIEQNRIPAELGGNRCRSGI